MGTRRPFGTIRKVTKKGYDYLEASYPTPLEARLKNPTLPKRITKTVRPEYETVLRAWLNEAEKQIMLDAWQDPTIKRAEHKATTTTFSQYATRYMKTHTKADGTQLAISTKVRNQNWLTTYLIPAFGHMPMNTITSKTVQDWWDTWPIGPNGESKVQRWNVYTLLRAIMNHATTTPIDDQGNTLIRSNPCTVKASRPRTTHEPIVAEYPELETLAHHMPNRLALAIYLGGVVGLREGEICALTREDIDLDKHRVHVNKSVKQLHERGKSRRLVIGPPKSENSYRKAPYPEKIHDIIVHHLDTFVDDAPDSLLFTSERRGELIAPQTLRNVWGKALKHVPRLKGMHFHDLRHTALTYWGEAGASLAQLMEIAGHSELKMVARYQQISISQRKQTATNLDKRLDSISSEQTPQDKEKVQEKHDSSSHDPLVVVLMGLPVESQAEIIRNLDKPKQAEIISQLPSDMQVALLSLLL